MHKFVRLIVFLSIILFSCSKSTEDKIIGNWSNREDQRVMVLTFKSDGTAIMYNGDFKDEETWFLSEDEKLICIDEGGSTPDCALLISINDIKMCIEDEKFGKIMCFDKISDKELNRIKK